MDRMTSVNIHPPPQKKYMKTSTPAGASALFRSPTCLCLLSGASFVFLLLLASALSIQAATKFYPDVVLVQFYDRIPGTSVSALTGSPKFPNSPDRVMFATLPEIPVDAANEYGTRITGVLIGQQAGSFHLIMNSDDQGA